MSSQMRSRFTNVSVNIFFFIFFHFFFHVMYVLSFSHTMCLRVGNIRLAVYVRKPRILCLRTESRRAGLPTRDARLVSYLQYRLADGALMKSKKKRNKKGRKNEVSILTTEFRYTDNSMGLCARKKILY